MPPAPLPTCSAITCCTRGCTLSKSDAVHWSASVANALAALVSSWMHSTRRSESDLVTVPSANTVRTCALTSSRNRVMYSLLSSMSLAITTHWSRYCVASLLTSVSLDDAIASRRRKWRSESSQPSCRLCLYSRSTAFLSR
jgi:hypothetical protein